MSTLIDTLRKGCMTMWKKILIMSFTLIGCFSFVYGYYNFSLYASGNNYQSGGNVTGRINKKPSNLNRSYGFSKGDKILMGTENPSDHMPISWILVDESTYSDYNCSSATTVCTNAQEITAWRSFSMDSMGKVEPGIVASDFDSANGAINGYVSSGDRRTIAVFSSFRNVTSILDKINADIKNSNDNEIITYRNLTTIHESYHRNSGTAIFFIANVFDRVSDYTDNVFIPSMYEVASDSNSIPSPYTVESRDLAFPVPYMSSHAESSIASHYYRSLFWFSNSGRRVMGPTDSYNKQLDIRLQAYLDLTKTVFAVSAGNTSGIATVTSPSLASGYQYLYRDAVGNPMKVRLEDESLTNSTTFQIGRASCRERVWTWV